jgi:hypothetical protein
VTKYISYIIDPKMKEHLDKKLSTLRQMIGLKKDEINWGQVAVLALGAVVVAGGIASVFGDSDYRSSGVCTSSGGTFEYNVGDFSANNGGGLTDYL